MVGRHLRNALAWIGVNERRLLFVLLLVVGGAWLFVELAGEVSEGETQAFDELVLRTLRDPFDPSQPRGPLWLKEAARDVTALGSVAVLSLFLLAVTGFLAIQRRYSAMWLLLLSTLGGALLSTGLKELFARARPSVVPHFAEVSTASFPSGHSMLAAIVYLTLGVLLARVERGMYVRAYLVAAALGLTLLVGLSRIYLGVHYPTDVLGGWAAGLAWALLCWVIATALQRGGKVERGGD